MSNTLDRAPERLRYDGNTIALHWATALLVALLWGGGQTFRAFGRPFAPTLHAVHISLGITLVAVLCARVAWRLTRGTKLPDPAGDLLHRIARGMHLLLYVMAGLVVSLGITTAFTSGDSWFGVFAFPRATRTLAHNVHNLHALAANTLLALAGAHAAAALLHHYVLRDGVLRRMLPLA